MFPVLEVFQKEGYYLIHTNLCFYVAEYKKQFQIFYSKFQVRKSESGSDGQKSVMVKSGSFSGTSAAPAKLHERSSVSESAVARHSSAEDESLLQLPIFQLGPIDHIDSDIDKASTQGTEEQLSSFSEQAWDNYQVRELFNVLINKIKLVAFF